MSVDIKAELVGYREAVKALDALADRFQRQVIMKMLRKGTRPLIRAARSKLKGHGSQFTELAKSIGNITAKSKNPIILAGPRIKGKWKSIGYIAHWVEYGSYGRKKGMKYRPFPFMRPAIDSQTPEVKLKVTESFKKHLQTAIDKTVAKIKKR